MTEYFSILDYGVFAGMLLISALIGIYFAFFAATKQNTTSEYLMGGKTMGIFPISMSLIASYISGISLLGIPAEIYVYGTQYWLIVVSETMVSFTMSVVYIPVFYNLQITSSYEYLYRRFNKKVRTLGCLLFLIKMMLYIPVVIYVPALAFSQVTGFNLHYITPAVCAVCIFYTTLGGLKAVVWTDTVQMFVMVLGVATVMGIGTYDMGFSTIIERNMKTDRIEFDRFDLDPTVRHTVWSVVFGNYFLWLATCSVNQSMVQRCLAMPSLRQAIFSIINLAIGIITLVSMCCYTGLVVYAYFYDCDPISTKKIGKSDQLLPYYVMAIGDRVPGLPGIFISGVFSAALSTMSTGLNSMTGVIFEDIIRPMIKKPLNESASSVIMKITVVLIGACCIGLVFIVEKLGALIQAGKSLAGITAGPLLGLFTLGMFVPWANSNGAFIGGILSLMTTSTLSIMSQTAIASGALTFPKKPVFTDSCPHLLPNMTLPSPGIEHHEVWWIVRLSYLWYTLIGSTVVMIVGCLVSLATGPVDYKKTDIRLYTPIIHRFLPQYKVPQEERKEAVSVKPPVTLNSSRL